MKKNIALLVISLIVPTIIFAAKNANIEYKKIVDKDEVYLFLFSKHKELRDPDCHRSVHTSRSPQTMVAMGCKLYQLEIDKSSLGSDKVEFKAMYQCEESKFPFTAHCYLK